MMRRAVVLGALASWAPSLAAQSIAQRIGAVRDGMVRFAYAAAPGVCGNGDGGVSVMGRNGRDGQYWGARVCEHGPVRVSLGRSDGQTISVRKYVGGRWSASSSEATDLGVLDATDAARYLLSLAPSLGGRNGSEAVAAAAIADASIAPELTRVVQNGDAPIDTRKDALFWLGESEISAAEFARLYDRAQPLALREQWTFVLAQRHEDVALDKLIDIARNDSDVEIRKKAMFWLGQSRDPKAIRFLHDILLR